MQVMLNGPLQPAHTMTFPTFQMGAMVPGLAKVRCGMVEVAPLK
jgi:hypothetical protein